MKNPGKKDLDAAVARRLKGEAWKTILPGTGLSHSQAERHEFRFKMWLQANGAEVEGDWSPIEVKPDATPEAIGRLVQAHRATGTSWGVIGERMGLPESRIRRCFEAATNIQSQGLRIAHGGRFLQDNEALYTPTPDTGVVIPVGASVPSTATKDGFAAGAKFTPEQRKLAGDLQAQLADRRAKRLEAVKAERSTKANAKPEAPKAKPPVTKAAVRRNKKAAAPKPVEATA